MRFLVTGGSGFIGTHLVEALLEAKQEVLNVDIKPPNLPVHTQYWKERDIMDREALMADFQKFGPDCVVHLAARTDTLSNRIDDYQVNTTGTENVLDAIKATDTVQRVIITSTQFVNQYHGLPEHDLDFKPHTVYGESKVIMEQATRSADLGCTWTIIRPTNIWGPWHPRYAQEFWRVLSKGLYLHPGGGRVIRSYGYVENVIYQILQMLEAAPERVNGKVYYVGDEPIDLLDWVNGFSLGLTGKKARIVPRFVLQALGYLGDLLALLKIEFPMTSSRFKSMTTSNAISMDTVIREFGQPPWSLAEGIEKTVAWLEAHYPGNFKGRIAK